MNHIYRSLWSPATGTCIATSEHVAGNGKTHSKAGNSRLKKPAQSQRGPSDRMRASSIDRVCRRVPVALMLAWGGLAMASPTGGAVSAGNASIVQTPVRTTITQTSPHVAINWQSFGIAAGQSVQFVQPGRQAIALNRVIGADPSAILGQLSANGQVFLVNPNGILFGTGSSVNMGGLVASTLNISDGDFMSGRYRFSGSGTAELVNQGALHAADGGYVALLGARVNNLGSVVAQRGYVTMAAGQTMSLDLLGDQLLNVHVEQGVANALLRNGGVLQADGGQVLMTTQAAGNLLANVVNNTGVVQAQTVENRQGTIVLLGSMDSGTVNLGGTLDVSAGLGQKAGRVLATGQQVGLFDAHILASGGAGGGQVLIGGGYQGRDPAVPNAKAVYMNAGATIEANAREQGDGGQVVLWSDGSTRALGQVSARGGSFSGNGGLIETSGQWLDVGGLRVDTRAPLGQIGTWLLDPAGITISSAATTDTTATGGVFAPNSGVSAANVNVADLVTALGSSNVTVTTANTGVGGAGLGDINVNAVITWTAPTTLSLNAARDVNVNQAITGTDGSLAVTAGRDVTVGAAVTTTTGQIGFTAVQDVKLNAATTITTGNLQAVAGRNVSVSAASTVTTGNMVLRADNDGTGPGAAAGTVAITCVSNCLTIGTGELNIRFNPVNYASTGSEILAYASKLTGGGTLNAKAWVFGLGDNKVYDGTTTATVSGLMPDVTAVPPPVALGSVSLANFDTRHVGTDKAITYASTFSDATYDLFATAAAPVGTYQARADITPRPLAVNAVTDARTYNGTTSSVGAPTVTGLQTGDTLNGALTQAFASKDVLGVGASTLVASGSYSVSDGNGGNNYSVSVLTAPGTISPATLAITAQNVSKVYGQAPALTGFDASALVNGETVGSVTLTSAGQAATAGVVGSPYAIVPSNATGGSFTPSNYSISYVNGALTVTPLPVVPPEVVQPVVVVPEVPPVEVAPEVVVPDAGVPPAVPPVVAEPGDIQPPTEQPIAGLPDGPTAETPNIAQPVQQALSSTSETQSLPRVPGRDKPAVLLRVLPVTWPVQGPVTLAATRIAAPLPAPAPEPVTAPLAVQPQTATEAKQPSPLYTPAVEPTIQRAVPPPLPRRPKPDRN